MTLVKYIPKKDSTSEDVAIIRVYKRMGPITKFIEERPCHEDMEKYSEFYPVRDHIPFLFHNCYGISIYFHDIDDEDLPQESPFNFSILQWRILLGLLMLGAINVLKSGLESSSVVGAVVGSGLFFTTGLWFYHSFLFKPEWEIRRVCFTEDSLWGFIKAAFHFYTEVLVYQPLLKEYK